MAHTVTRSVFSALVHAMCGTVARIFCAVFIIVLILGQGALATSTITLSPLSEMIEDTPLVQLPS